MAFAYRQRAVWLRDLDMAFDRFGEYPLCEMHADRLVAPSGWTLTDGRLIIEPPLFVDRDVA